MAEIIGYIGRAQTLSAELSTPQTITGSLCGGASHGIPAGGEPGQGLIKVSDTDYDVKWMSILPEDTASGAVASFPDGADDLPMGVVVDIDPVQDLHGFDNPWPGGGGKNKFDEQFRQGSALDLSNTARVVASKSIYVEQGKTYTFSASNYSAFNYVINSAQADSLPISGSYNYCGAGLDWLARTNTFTATNSGYVFVCVRKPDNSDIVPSDVANVKMQFEESSTATAYAPYSNICPISGWTKATIFHSGADTSNPTEYEIPFSTSVYGGTLNVETGECVVDRAIVDLGTLDWTYASVGTRSLFTSYNLGNKYKPSGSNNIPAKAAFECYANVSMSATFKNGEAGLDGNTSNRIVICDNRYTDAVTFKSVMSGMQLCYELATPITLTFDPVEIRSLLGDNNVWADTGDVSVTYLADVQKYIDKKISAAVAAMS